jgi:hypothetical protein
MRTAQRLGSSSSGGRSSRKQARTKFSALTTALDRGCCEANAGNLKVFGLNQAKPIGEAALVRGMVTPSSFDTVGAQVRCTPRAHHRRPGHPYLLSPIALNFRKATKQQPSTREKTAALMPIAGSS